MRKTSRRIAIGAAALGAMAASATPAIAATGKGITPDIAVVVCSANPTAVHIDTTAGGLICLGTDGTLIFADPEDPGLFSFCAGNNYGSYVEYDSGLGETFTSDFSAGFAIDYDPDVIHVESVTITRHSGSDTC